MQFGKALQQILAKAVHANPSSTKVAVIRYVTSISELFDLCLRYISLYLLEKAQGYIICMQSSTILIQILVKFTIFDS